MRALGLTIGLWCLVVLALGMPAAHGQPDSARAAILKAKGFSPEHSPKGAVWRAAAVPGWGQFYNRQYLKVPFVYAGLAWSGYAVYMTNKNYILYRHAAIYARGQSLSETEREIPDVISNWKAFEDDYEEVSARVGGELEARQLRQVRDKYRRWRDLAIVGAGLFYALTILDAYVSAHLLTFDTGDVAVRMGPAGGGRTPTTLGSAAGVGLRLGIQF